MLRRLRSLRQAFVLAPRPCIAAPAYWPLHRDLSSSPADPARTPHGGPGPGNHDRVRISPVWVLAEAGNASALKLALGVVGCSTEEADEVRGPGVGLPACSDHALALRSQVGVTALSIAALNGHAAAMRVLIDAGANVMALSDNDTTPLHLAAGAGQAAAVQMLLANPGVHPNALDTWGRTPLGFAAVRGRAGAIAFLISDPRVEVDLRDNDDCTPLCLASCAGQVAVVAALLASPAVDPNALCDGKPPLHWRPTGTMRPSLRCSPAIRVLTSMRAAARAEAR